MTDVKFFSLLALACAFFLGEGVSAPPPVYSQNGRASPRPNLDLQQVIQQMRHSLTDLKQVVHVHEEEIEKLNQKMAYQEETVDHLKEELTKEFSTHKENLETYSNENVAKFNEIDQLIRSLENHSKGLLNDVKQLKTQSNDLVTALNNYQERAAQIDKVIEAQNQHMEKLEAALRTLVEIVSGSSTAPTQKTYKVQPGDSLGKIAQNLKVPLKALREANPSIKEDKIVVGQSLKIP